MNHIKIATELENENTMGIKESQDVFFSNPINCVMWWIVAVKSG